MQLVRAALGNMGVLLCWGHFLQARFVCIERAGGRVFCVELCVDHFKRCPLLLFACVCEIRRLLCRIWHGLDMHFEIYCGIVWLVTFRLIGCAPVMHS